MVSAMSRIKEFNLPDLGEGLTEGEILAWLVKVGDTVELNQPIVEVETAKAAVEIPAKWAGTVTKIHHEAGTTVAVGMPIIAIDTNPGAGPLPSATSVEPAASASGADPAGEPVEDGKIGGAAPGGRTAVLVGYGPKTATAVRRPRKTPGGTATQSPPPPAATTPSATIAPAQPTAAQTPSTAAAPPTSAPAPSTAPAPPTDVPARSTDAPARRTVAAKPPVRKLARDLGVDLALVSGTGPSGSITRDDVHLAVSTEPEAGPADVSPPTTAAVFDASREQRIPVKGVRRLTAENMVASAFTAPHVTMFLQVDVTRSMKSLDRLKARPEWRDLRISPLLLVAKAVLLAARRHPMVNSTWVTGPSGAEIVVKEYVNLGIAAATFTITNVGVFGIDSGTPILPPGETAILAFGAIRPTPWARKGKIRIRQVTTLGLSFDHRIVDGELGSRFLCDVGRFLEDPEAALLSWT
jgi:pyruvate dehydrogenase E2 component (dihydrolipoamide acetyltransferase)